MVLDFILIQMNIWTLTRERVLYKHEYPTYGTVLFSRFDRDLRWRTGVEIIPVKCYSNNNFEITLAALERAYLEGLNKKHPIKAILITNPSNPLGLTISPQTLTMILDFAAGKSIHVISDEVYAGTVFSSQPFTSVLEIVQSSNKYDPETVHVVYSLSKDLGLPGFRIGAIYSSNPRIITASRRMSSFSLVSSQTQVLLKCLLSDSGFMGEYLSTIKQRLKRRHSEFKMGLKEMGIESLEGNAGLFSWVNLRSLLVSDNWEGELKLWRVILEDIGINVSPGCSFHCEEPGWFRVCYGNMSEDEMYVALSRIKGFISAVGGGAQEMMDGLAMAAAAATTAEGSNGVAVAACTSLGLDGSDFQPEPLAH